MLRRRIGFGDPRTQAASARSSTLLQLCIVRLNVPSSLSVGVRRLTLLSRFERLNAKFERAFLQFAQRHCARFLRRSGVRVTCRMVVQRSEIAGAPLTGAFAY